MPDGLALIVLRQAWAELAVSLRRLRFRTRANAAALSAYCAMSVGEFEAVNARQRWANWRTIPRSLHGRLPSRPCRAVDLCSGVGDSTETLACVLPAGSTILGLEYNPEFVRKARGRIYRGAGGEPVEVAFRAQSVLEPFRDAAGELLSDGGVDLVNASGALAVNFDEAALDGLSAEIARVLGAGGLAAVDSAANGAGQERMIRRFTRRGFELLGAARSCRFDRFSQLCFRRLR